MKRALFEKFLSEMETMSVADIKEAMNRDDFRTFMNKGLKGLLVGAYDRANQKATYQEITVSDTSNSDRENYPSMGSPAIPLPIQEGEAYKQLAPGSPDDIPVTNFKYGGILELTEEAGDDDQTPGKQLRKQAQKLGAGSVKLKDIVFYSLLTSNGTIYDGQNFFSLNHPGYTGGAARVNNDNIYTNVTMSANALATALGIIGLWEGADPDEDLDVTPEKIVCGLRLQQTAFGLTNADLLPFAMAAGPLGPGATVSGGMPNAMKGKLGVTVSHRLDKVAPLDWYIKTDFPGILYQTRKGMVVTQEAMNAGETFIRDLLRWKISERFGRKVINWRWGILIS